MLASLKHLVAALMPPAASLGEFNLHVQIINKQ